MQKLFAELQFSRKEYVLTKDLTRSFGWDRGDAFQQQDSQEFARVVLDSIEQSFAIAGQSSEALNNLYKGIMTSYVECQECGYSSKNNQPFMDIVLPIMNEFGTGVLNSSLEMAIENYLKPEILEKDNQYQCSSCDKKVDAKKGQRIEKLPDHLMIVLNRFTLDFSTF